MLRGLHLHGSLISLPSSACATCPVPPPSQVRAHRMQDHATALLCLASTIHHSIPFPRTFAFRRHRLYWILHDTSTAAVAVAIGGRSRAGRGQNMHVNTPRGARAVAVANMELEAASKTGVHSVIRFDAHLVLPPSQNKSIFRFGQSQIYSTLTIIICMNELF